MTFNIHSVVQPPPVSSSKHFHHPGENPMTLTQSPHSAISAGPDTQSVLFSWIYLSWMSCINEIIQGVPFGDWLF